MTEIQLRDVRKAFGGLQVLDGLDLDFKAGGIQCLFGPSGCGKSTLLNLMAGTEPLDSGTIMGVDALKWAYVFQEERLLPWYTVRKNIEVVLENHPDPKWAEKQVDRTLDLVDLKAFEHALPKTLSGGMRQRVSLARAFAFEGQGLILDEPFKGLHLEMKYALMDQILSYIKTHNPITLLVTHDVEEALYLADTIYCFSGPPMQLMDTIEIELPQATRRLQPELLAPFRARLI